MSLGSWKNTYQTFIELTPSDQLNLPQLFAAGPCVKG